MKERNGLFLRSCIEISSLVIEIDHRARIMFSFVLPVRPKMHWDKAMVRFRADLC